MYLFVQINSGNAITQVHSILRGMHTAGNCCCISFFITRTVLFVRYVNNNEAYRKFSLKAGLQKYELIYIYFIGIFIGIYDIFLSFLLIIRLSGVYGLLM